MRYVFVSYVRDNQAIVDRLYKDLSAHGIRVWLDRNDIEPGFLWEDAIRRAISNGTFFIACFSIEYESRDSTYMNEELSLAIDELRKRPANRAWFIPICFSGSVPDWSIGAGRTLASIQRLDFNEKNWNDSVQRLTQAIKPSLLQESPQLIRTLVSQTTGIDYSGLRDILSKGNWDEADKETTHQMLKAAHQENQGWLDAGAIQKFSIEDLIIIDQLWFAHSDGKHGFRVLTKAWKESGSPTNYSSEIGRDQWDRFGVNVGWKIDGEWMYLYPGKRSSTILPFEIFVIGGTRLDGKFWILFSRLDACQVGSQTRGS